MKLEKEIATHKLVVFDMDHALLQEPYADACAKHYNFRQALNLVKQIDDDVVSLTRRTAAFLRDRSKKELVDLAENIPLVPGIGETIFELRNRQYHIGIITHSYQFVSQIVARKIGADFELSNELVFMAGNATGEVLIPSYFHYNYESNCRHQVCKTNALRYICRQYQLKVNDCIVIGVGEGNECILDKAGKGLVFRKPVELAGMVRERNVEEDSFRELLKFAV